MEGKFGTSPRIPVTGFVVFGVLTFWVYTAVRLAQLWRAHAAARRDELGARRQGQDASPDPGFATDTAIPQAAAAAFALSGALVAFWFVRWIVIGDLSDPRAIVGSVGVSAALFYGATVALVLWLAVRIRRHEEAELPAFGRALPADDFVARWEAINSHNALFLIVAAPMVASPVVGAYLFVTRSDFADSLALPLLCFVLAAAFHGWGTRLLVSLFNGHLALERGASFGPARAAASAGTAPAGERVEPYEGGGSYIFVSYKRTDLPRVMPVLQRVESWGYHLWYDKGIPGAAEWDALIERKVKECALLLFFVSAGSVESKHCRREVKYADMFNKPILSVRLEAADLKHGLGMLLTQYQMLDADAQDFSREIERALTYLRLL